MRQLDNKKKKYSLQFSLKQTDLKEFDFLLSFFYDRIWFYSVKKKFFCLASLKKRILRRRKSFKFGILYFRQDFLRKKFTGRLKKKIKFYIKKELQRLKSFVKIIKRDFRFFFFFSKLGFKFLKRFFFSKGINVRMFADILKRKKKNEKELKKKKIIHYKKNIVLTENIVNSFLLNKNLFKFKTRFLLNSFIKFDPIFFSFLFNKFLNKAMCGGKKNKFFFIFSSILLLIKFFTSLRPFFIFFSSLESSRVIVGHLPKNISGRIEVVPTFLYFDKQIQTAISIFTRALRAKQTFTNVSVTNFNFKNKKFLRLAGLFIKNQKIYFSTLSKFMQRKNFVFDILKQNYVLYLKKRSNLQYRWR